MSYHQCPDENEIIAAVRSGSWTDALRAHLETCPQCQNIATVSKALQQSAAAATLTIPVSYRLLWMKARFARKQERLSHLERLTLLGIFAVGAICLTGIAFWQWHLLQRWLAAAVGDPGATMPFYLLAGCAALVWFLTEEIFLHER